MAAGEHPLNRAVDAAARDHIEAAGHGEHFGHGLGHGIGLATHELPSLGRLAAGGRRCRRPRCSPWSRASTSTARPGVRIEDLVVFDPAAGRLERLTAFPREVTVVG